MNPDEVDAAIEEAKAEGLVEEVPEEDEGKVNVKIYIPPRRRTATLDVALTNGKKLKLAVNKTGVRLSAPSNTYYSGIDSLTIPRNLDDLCRLRDLIDAGIFELEEQISLAEADK